MSPYRRQRLIEDRWDIIVAAVVLILMFSGLLTLPRWIAFGWLALLGLFWVRWNYVRVRRDERSLRAELAAHGGHAATGGDGGESRIGLPDRVEHGLIAGKRADAAREISRIVRGE